MGNLNLDNKKKDIDVILKEIKMIIYCEKDGNRM